MTKPRQPTFVDLFAGCGGLSLGLSQAGFQGLFAIEKSEHAFKTFRANFVDGGRPQHRFNWPRQVLPVKSHDIEELLDNHWQRLHLETLRGKVDLVAGGPPCQGFSFSGRRNADDPRNQLFEHYVEFVNLVLPRVLVLENVPGMLVAHDSGHRSLRGEYRPSPFFRRLKEALEKNYFVHESRMNAVDFGVPQRRERLIVLGIRKGSEWGDEREGVEKLQKAMGNLLANIKNAGSVQLKQLCEDSKPYVSVSAAISDLAAGAWQPGEKRPYEHVEAWTKECDGDGDDAEERVPGTYWRPYYIQPWTKYQKKMNDEVPRERMSSLRLARHTTNVQKRFAEIVKNAEKGVPLNKETRERLGLQKHRTFPLHGEWPAPTLTTLPDDLVHYSEPRILSVREYARLQSFPDWFHFRGKYTTGGHLRKSECPRYTQIGNAVPPLLARALGSGLVKLLNRWPDNTCNAAGHDEVQVPATHDNGTQLPLLDAY